MCLTFLFSSPLEQFEINSFNTFLTLFSTFSLENLEYLYFPTISYLNQSFFKIFFIFTIIIWIQTNIKNKSFFFLFLILQIIFNNINLISFSDILLINYEITEEKVVKLYTQDSAIYTLLIDLIIEFFIFTPYPEGETFPLITELSIFAEFIKEFMAYHNFSNQPIVALEPINFLTDSLNFNFVTIINSFINIYSVLFCFIFTYLLIYLIYNKMFSFNTNTLIPNLYQILAENLYKISLNLFYSILGKHVSIPEFFIKINTVFIFLILSNVQGMIPYISTLTSALTNTFFIALALFISILTTLFDKKGLKYFLNLFMPSGCPILLSLLIIPIELISYSFRLVSLSVRLFANMMAGHTLLKVIVGFSWIIVFLGNSMLINIFPILILFILTLLEFGVALIQAYIFTVLSCIYLRDIFEGH